MLSLSVIALIVGALSIPIAFFALGGGGVFLSLLFALGGLVPSARWAYCATRIRAASPSSASHARRSAS